jgi:cation diffusion facilitator CzcD-associated flavoprotein CzcO
LYPSVCELWKIIQEEMGVKRVAVIGLGPSGAITIDALAQEHAFDVIRVFERREAPGGCW